MRRAILTLILCMIGAVAFAQSYVIVAGDDVCLRAQPDESTKMTSYGSPRLYTGEVYPYYGTVGNYYRIGVNGRTYYIPKKYGRLR